MGFFGGFSVVLFVVVVCVIHVRCRQGAAAEQAADSGGQ